MKSGKLPAQTSDGRRCNMSQHAETDSEPTTPTIVGSAAAKRMRYHCERRREGIRCVTIELRETEVTELVQRKLLEAWRVW